MNQNMVAGSDEYGERIRLCVVKLGTRTVGVVIVSTPTFGYIIADKGFFGTQNWEFTFPNGNKLKGRLPVGSGKYLARFYLVWPSPLTIANAVTLSGQPVVRNQTCYMFNYAQAGTSVCGGNVRS